MHKDCIYCQNQIEINPNLVKSRPITQVFCKDCYHKLLKNSSKFEILNKIPASVIGYDFKGVVKIVNDHTQNLLQKDSNQIINKVGGEVIDCVYANHTNGCGHSLNCDECIILKYLNRTILTGESFFDIKGNQIVKNVDGLKQFDYKFSMEKLHDLVLVRVDKLIKG